jgi:RNA polymerase sigma factor (sigma-70 family)
MSRPPLSPIESNDPAEPSSGSPGGVVSAAGPDPTVIERLFREHNSALLRFVAVKLGSEQEAQEVAQEAYVRLLRLDHPEAISYLRAFLFKTAANLALDRLRARSRRPATRSLSDGELAIFHLSPDRQVEARQAVDIVREALAELPVKCREALLLYRLFGLRQPEIATRLGIKDRMVRMHIARAIEHLRLRMDIAKSETPGGERRL